MAVQSYFYGFHYIHYSMDTIVQRLVVLMGLLLVSVSSTLASMFSHNPPGRGPNSVLLLIGIVTLALAAYIAHGLFTRPEQIDSE